MLKAAEVTDLPEGRQYDELVEAVVDAISSAQREAAGQANAALVNLYWRIGTIIVARQQDEGYGTRVIERLSVDLRSRYPGQRGFSQRNLRYMRAFALAWPDDKKVQNLLQNLGWGQIQLLLDKLDEASTREWYAERAITDGWTHGVLSDRINAVLHEREGMAPSNFGALPTAAEDRHILDRLATDPYHLDFLSLTPGASEHQLESALVQRVTNFLTQLGTGFAYMGRQHRITVGDTDFHLDLLFYNTRLHCHVVFELKARPFEPADAGQLGFYVTAIDRQLKRDGDNPTIGILLVTDRDDLVVEYALADSNNPMAVARYTFNELPEEVQAGLPTAEELTNAVNPPASGGES